jgi:acetyltransferase
VGNPVDLTPQVEPARIAGAVRSVLDQADVAGVVAIDVGLDIPEFAEAVIAAARATGKPAVAFTADAPGIAARFRAGGVPVLPSPERAVRGFRALWAARAVAPAAPGPPRALPADLAAALRAGSGPLPYALARRVLESFGVPFCREAIASTPEAAVAAAGRIGYPVVIKADAPGLIHRTEVGGVRLGVPDAAAVRRACAELQAGAGAHRFVVQEQVARGVELIAGVRRDEVFGPVIAVGTGGVLAEVIRDVSVRLAPLSADEAHEMLREGARARLLAGPRGLPACDDGPLVSLLLALSELACAEPRIAEVDLNPVIAAGARAVAVDALVILEAP